MASPVLTLLEQPQPKDGGQALPKRLARYAWAKWILVTLAALMAVAVSWVE